MSSTFNSFLDENILVKELSSKIIEKLEEAISKNSKASLLVSGGNTPKLLFEKLSNIDISWEKITIALVDERWVDTTDQNSNEYLVKEYLLQNFAKKAKFVGMYIENKNIYDCETLCSKKYFEELYPFDILILGMGEDAHTASFFPNNEKLKEAFSIENKKLCISIEPTNAPYKRMSLTLSAILKSSNIFLHIQSEEKLKVFKEAIASKNIYEKPISAVLNQNSVDIEVYYS